MSQSRTLLCRYLCASPDFITFTPSPVFHTSEFCSQYYLHLNDVFLHLDGSLTIYDWLFILLTFYINSLYSPTCFPPPSLCFWHSSMLILIATVVLFSFIAHQLNGHEFEKGLGVGDGKGSLAFCSPWGCKESDMTEQLNWTELMIHFIYIWKSHFASFSY